MPEGVRETAVGSLVAALASDGSERARFKPRDPDAPRRKRKKQDDEGDDEDEDSDED